MGELHHAIRTGHLNRVSQMLDQNPEWVHQLDDRGFPPLVLSTYSNQYAISQLLLDRGALVDARDAAGNTALMGVSVRGFLDLAKLLIEEYGAAVDQRNRQGSTALSFAATFGHTSIARLLMAHGADPHLADDQGQTPLSIATAREYQAFLDLVREIT